MIRRATVLLAAMVVAGGLALAITFSRRRELGMDLRNEMCRANEKGDL
jgi:hypothetical protein